MRLRLQSHHGPVGLFAACTLLSFGCASILGADFDKPFQPDGKGGAGGALVTVTATTTVTGSGGSGGAGGMGGSGGSGPVADCPKQAGQSSGFCTVHVYIKKTGADAGLMAYGASDAFLTFDEAVPQDYEPMPTSTFRLSRTSLPFVGVALFSCAEEDGRHTIALTSPCEHSTFLGYMANQSSAPVGYEPLVRFSTGVFEGIDRAFIALTDQTEFCDDSVSLPYGLCKSSSYSALPK